MADLKNVQGLRELQAALKELPAGIARNVLRGSVNAGATVIRKEAASRAPVSTGPKGADQSPPGTVKRSVYQKQIRELSNLVKQTFFVGVRQGKQYRNQGKKGNLSQDALDTALAGIRRVDSGALATLTGTFPDPAASNQ